MIASPDDLVRASMALRDEAVMINNILCTPADGVRLPDERARDRAAALLRAANYLKEQARIQLQAVPS